MRAGARERYRGEREEVGGHGFFLSLPPTGDARGGGAAASSLPLLAVRPTSHLHNTSSGEILPSIHAKLTLTPATPRHATPHCCTPYATHPYGHTKPAPLPCTTVTLRPHHTISQVTSSHPMTVTSRYLEATLRILHLNAICHTQLTFCRTTQPHQVAMQPHSCHMLYFIIGLHFTTSLYFIL